MCYISSMSGSKGWSWCMAVFAVVSQAFGDEHLSLNGMWDVVNSNGSVCLKGRVPGSIYTDLVEAGILGDPYYRFNDLLYRWVSYDNWTYSTTFNVSSDFLSYQAIDLNLGGVDTVAMVTLNGKVILQTDNMFRRYSVSVKDLLQGVNTLSVAFESPVLYGLRQSTAYPYDVPPDCPVPDQEGECHNNFVRKEASSFSWDWGPAFPTMGIWRNITLDGYNTAAITYIVTQTNMVTIGDDMMWSLKGRVHFSTVGNPEGLLIVALPSVKREQNWNATISDSGWVDFEMNFSQNEVKPWWPNGHGDQSLYDLVVTFRFGIEVTKRKHTIGFRTVELVQEPIPGSKGLSFYFKINGVPIFMKGSNWIPADSFQERITPEYLRRLLTSAADANMNMLRVWGGGVYESEEFYSLADQLGIMIWQDFMFACAMYPTNKDFLDTVRKEVTHQTRRLAHHPSIAIWAGNNENEGALRQNWYRTQPQYQRYYQDYVTLYVDTVRSVVTAEDSSRPFVTSSPSNGVETEKEGWVAKQPQDPLYGDVHYYNYDCDSWNWASYPKPRFASEYGFQSWPSLHTVMSVSKPGDWGPQTNFSAHRQHHPNGNQQLVAEMTMHMNLTNWTDPRQMFDSFIYQTQINQAVGIKTETELYRRLQSHLVEGEGMTMGALYWQLNDIWQAPTWASIEYGGRWKMLHYYAQRFYNQTLVSPALNGSMVQVYYISDKPASEIYNALLTAGNQGSDNKLGVKQEISRFGPRKEHNTVLTMSQEDRQRREGDSMDLYIKTYSWDNMEPKKVTKISFNEPDQASALVHQADVPDLLTVAGCQSVNHCFLWFSAQLHGNEISNNWLLLSNFTTAIGLQRAKVQITSCEKVDDMTFKLTVTTDHIAPFVWLETCKYEGRFSDNGFMMVDITATVYFKAWESVEDEEDLKNFITIRSFMDAYAPQHTNPP